MGIPPAALAKLSRCWFKPLTLAHINAARFEQRENETHWKRRGIQMRFFWLLAICLFSTLVTLPVLADESAPEQEVVWVEQTGGGDVRLHLYFFWTKHCPHCRDARPFVEQLPRRFPWLTLHALQLGENRDNAVLYAELAATVGQQARSVPAFIFCGNMSTGYTDEQSTGAWLVEQLQACRDWALKSGFQNDDGAEAPKAEAAELPALAGIDLQSLSLPAMTLVLAALDSFNPCAFFVLLFLLSLLVHARSRARMLLVGGTFVLISGLTYFLFMAAWLNVFMFSSQIRWVTLAAGVVAIVIALVNIKDFFWFKRGISLSIPEQAKPGLFKRMRGLVNAKNLPTMMLGTLVLAMVANSYELLCTAGFPMVFTRILTLNDMPPSTYYGYLALYNVIYVIPLLLIVTVFSLTLGARKLTEAQGRSLKLLSGLMMLGLGSLLVFAPDALNNLATALILLLTAVGLTWILGRWRERSAGDAD